MHAVPKYQKVAAALRADIQDGTYQARDALRADIQDGTYQARDALPTEHALCERFQVSRQTVRQALALLEEERLIERRQGSGSYVRDLRPAPQQPRRSIAVVTTYISDYIFPRILREIEAVLSENQGTPLLFSTQNEVASERRVLRTLLDLEPLDGVLVEGTRAALPNPNLDLYRKLIERGIPLVFFHGSYTALADVPAVLDDNFAGGRMLVEHLYARGHRNIAGIFKSDDLQGHQRFSGYAAALHELDLPLEDRHVLWYTTEQKERFLRWDFSAVQLDRLLDGCTAVVCYNDEIASPLVVHLTQRGIAIPGEMAVVSFDNSQYSEMSVPRITSLSHGSRNVGRQAAELLFRLLDGGLCQTELVPWTLVQKESS